MLGSLLQGALKTAALAGQEDSDFAPSQAERQKEPWLGSGLPQSLQPRLPRSSTLLGEHPQAGREPSPAYPTPISVLHYFRGKPCYLALSRPCDFRKFMSRYRDRKATSWSLVLHKGTERNVRIRPTLPAPRRETWSLFWREVGGS